MKGLLWRAFAAERDKFLLKKKAVVTGLDGRDRFVGARHLLVFTDKNLAAFQHDAFLLLKFF